MRPNLSSLFAALILAAVSLHISAQVDTNFVGKQIAVAYKWNGDPVVIDGIGDDTAWEQNADNQYDCNKMSNYGFRDGEFDLTATWQVIWNDTGIFFLVQVTDEMLNRYVDHPDLPFYESDNITLYFNPTGSRNLSEPDNYPVTESSFVIVLPGNEYNSLKMPGRFLGGTLNGDRINESIAFSYSDQGYKAEFYIPFNWIVPDHTTGIIKRWGFDISVSDADVSYREGNFFWNDGCDQQWQNVNAMGIMFLNLPMEPVPGQIIIQNQELCNFKPQATIIYAGSKNESATYEWDLDNPVSVLGAGSDTLIVQWDDFASRDIKLIINDNETKDTLRGHLDVKPIAVLAGIKQVSSGIQLKFLENCLSTTNEWDFDGAMVSVDNEIYTAIWDSPGIKNIRVIARNMPMVDTFSIRIEIKAITDNISDKSVEMPFKVYPVPYINTLIVEFMMGTTSPIQIAVYNLLGVKLYEYTNEHPNSGNLIQTIPAGELWDADGLKIMEVKIADKTYSVKLIQNIRY